MPEGGSALEMSMRWVIVLEPYPSINIDQELLLMVFIGLYGC